MLHPELNNLPLAAAEDTRRKAPKLRELLVDGDRLRVETSDVYAISRRRAWSNPI